MTVPDAAGELALPGLREDIQLLPGPETVGGAPTWAIFDPVRNRYFRIGWVAFELLSRWPVGSAERLVQAVNDETTCRVDLEDVKQLIRFLFRNNLTLTSAGGSVADFIVQHEASRPNRLLWLFQNYLFLRFPLVRPDAFFQKIVRYLDPVFSPALRNALLFSGVLGLFLISRQWDTFVTTFLYFFSLEGIFYFALGLVVVKICHELGHALTATRYGSRIASMGIAFLVFFPVLYTDTTDVYRLTSRRKRLYVSAAGILTEFYLALLCIFLWSFLPDGIFRSVVFVLGTVSFTLTVLINMNPFLRFDGYYFLADWLGIENLQDRAFALGKWKLREILFGLKDDPPEKQDAGMQRFLIVFAWSTWTYRFFLLLAIALVVYYFFFKLLGLILFAGVLITFILMPIAKEIAVWWEQRHSIDIRRAAFLSGSAIVLLLLFFLPWRSSIDVPAIVEPLNQTKVFAPVPGRIASVEVSVGDEVREGQSILALESPGVEEEIRRTGIEIGVLELRLQRVAASTEDLENLQVLQQRLQENQTKLSALNDLREQLVLRSPINGTVVELADSLHPGRWINEELPVAFIIDPTELILKGVVRESDLGRVAPAYIARFVPDDVTRAGIDAHVIEVQHSNLAHLDLPYLASVYGGDVAVRQDGQGNLVPETSVYRLALSVDGEHPNPDSVIRGVAQIEGERMSFARRAYEVIAAAFVRGSAL